MGTYLAKPAEVTRRWFVVDANGQTLGRIASKIASVLRGKHRPIFTEYVDTGDFVVVINAEKIKMTGKKHTDKALQRHSGIPGGFRSRPYGDLLKTQPDLVIETAVKGMLPKCPLGRQMLTKLKVYAGPKHPHAAQKPAALAV